MLKRLWISYGGVAPHAPRGHGWPGVAVLLLGICPVCAPAAELDPLFASHEVLSVQLSGPLGAIARDRAADPEDRLATLAYRTPDGDWRSFEIGLKPRGHSRRDREVCRFPPLRVDFKRKDVADSLFDGQNKLKLVTHCRSAARYDRYVYKEFLAYRMLNVVTDASFRVRPLEVEYVDVDRPGQPQRRFGFFIEDKERLAGRLGLEAVEPESIDPGSLEQGHATLMAFYQLLIGNTDFSFIAGPEADHCCHNVALLVDSVGRHWPMPYDFDISGFVDPPYAVVDYQLPIRNVRQRLYRGFCGAEEPAVARFVETRPRILELLRQETPLDAGSRQAAIDYVEAFFALLADPAALKRQVLDRCRGGGRADPS